MAEDTRDILMLVVTSTGLSPHSECTSRIGADDGLAKSQSGGSTTYPAFATSRGKGANYFAVEDFTMQVSLAGDSGGSDAATTAANADMIAQQKEFLKSLQEKNPELGGAKVSGAKSSSEYSRFITGGKAALGNRAYSADLEFISITRQADASSLTLMKSCLTSSTLRSASLLKRKATGSKNSDGTHELRGFLRFDFKDVLIYEFGWDEDDLIKEKFKFVCRESLVTYYLEEASGKLTPAGRGTWSRLNLGTGS